MANENPRTLLKADIEHNALETNKTSQNLLIKGDNLEVLKHLKNAYESAIKMIYIDPPYNTGGDGFVYNDDRKFTIDELSRLAGVSFEEAKRIMDFTTSNSNSHSAWLTFMYPRLYVARELLKDDGVIFISIDDNEASQLKLLCDEVFGEENFVGDIIWEKRYGRSNNAKLMTNSTEHILFYRKTEKVDILKENRSEEHQDTYSNPDNDYRGVWTSVSFVNQVTREARPNLSYAIKNPNTNETIEHPTNAWKVSKDKYELLLKENRLYWGSDGKAKYPRIKRFLSELDDGMVPINLWKFKEAGTADLGTKELKILMGINAFTFPKPTLLIKKMLSLFNPKDCNNKNEIILDFFAGSGTTAHAVMDLNAQDGGNRKFILVQIAEPTDSKSEAYKAGYKTIFDITKERILRASAKIKSEIAQDITKDSNDYDLGFKIFETTPLLENPLDTMDAFNEETPTLFDVSTLTDDDFNALLTTWKVHDGMKLTDKLQEITLQEYKAYYGDKKLYFVHGGFDIEDLKALILRLDKDKSFQPNKLIVFGYSFDSKYQREISEALGSYTNKKSIELDMIVRY
ncbi:MAG: hypothetical protein KU38_05645 [Sulfurovum sp. FS08-3]|nr:MAG: hypothetical protein KU38_05645 [Sulfurovum sp. FS08-3]